MSLGDFLKTLIPTAAAIILSMIAGWVALSGRLAVIETKMDAIQGAYVPREVVTLQLKNLSLRVQSLGEKVDAILCNQGKEASK